jgi:hypothetical protein
VPGKNLDYYVRAAGGPAHKADTKRVYVKQANGKVESVKRRFMLPDDVPVPGPGAEVYVPEREPDAKSNLMDRLPVLASILASLATVVLVAR